MNLERILVIKLSALGDFIQAFGPFNAIRRTHPQARITLLTTAPYAALAKQSPWFDEVWIDTRPKLWQVAAMLRLRRQLRSGRFQRVYDLQTSQRSSSYLRLLGGPQAVQWSGIAPGCSHPHANPDRDRMHTIDRQTEQLAMAGITVGDWPSLDWLGDEQKAESLLQGRPAPLLLAPGGAPHRPEKRWPPAEFAALARVMADQGFTPIILGTDSEREAEQAILSGCPQAISLIGKTSFGDLAALARKATLAIGNDTGPMHLISISGCPSVVLYSAASNPELCGQAGPAVHYLRSDEGTMDFSPDMVAELALSIIGRDLA